MNIKTVTFLGGHTYIPGNKEYEDAKKTANLLAKSGLIILNGGGSGIMRASTEGAKLGGGMVMGITTYYGGMGRSNFEGVDPLNKFDKEIICDDYFQRTEKLLRNGDVHIIFNGGSGTVSEFGMTWAMSKIHDGTNKPIILFGIFWKDILKTMQKHMLIKQGEEMLFKVVTTPEQAFDIINGMRGR